MSISAPFGRLTTAMITPFKRDGEIDWAGIEKLAAHRIADALEQRSAAVEHRADHEHVEKRSVVRHHDHAVGRVAAALDRLGLADDTIIVYSADNGYYLGDRGFQGKWSHYDESLRVPLVIYDPRLPSTARGRVVERLTLNVDLPATFLDWAGLPKPSGYE